MNKWERNPIEMLTQVFVNHVSYTELELTRNNCPQSAVLLLVVLVVGAN